MSPLNRGSLMGPRAPPASMRPPMPRFGRAPPPPPGMARGMHPPPMSPMFGPRGRPIPPPPPRPVPMMVRPGPPGPPMFGPRGRPLPPIPPLPPMGLRGPIGMRGPMMRPGPRGVLPPNVLPHMRPRFPNNMNGKGKMNNGKKANKLEELELKKPWMTDEIRSEIQKKNKLYAKAKKNKDAKEWEEFKDLRNKVTRMIRDAKNEYLAKNPGQAHLYENDEEYGAVDDDNENVNDTNSEEELSIPYCEVCDRDFQSEEMLERHINEHQTCKIDGCTFTAHPKIVDKHITMQHSTGLYQRMKNLSSEEDVKKWLVERKKRYPTTANAKLQEAAQLEKARRGEIIKKNQKQTNQIKTKKENLRKNRKRKRNRTVQIPIPQQLSIEREVYRGLLPFAGTAVLDEKEHSDNSSLEDETVINDEIMEECDVTISDEGEQMIDESSISEPVIDQISKPKTVIPQSLSLVADYGSDSENDEPPDEVPIKKSISDENKISPKSESQTKSNESIQNLQASPIENCQASSEEKSSPLVDDSKSKVIVNKNININNQKIIEKEKHISENKQKLNKFVRRKFNNSEYSNGRLRLLNKLLARSIQHERNAICQCITFIAKNNFFD